MLLVCCMPILTVEVLPVCWCFILVSKIDLFHLLNRKNGSCNLLLEYYFASRFKIFVPRSISTVCQYGTGSDRYQKGKRKDPPPILTWYWWSSTSSCHYVPRDTGRYHLTPLSSAWFCTELGVPKGILSTGPLPVWFSFASTTDFYLNTWIGSMLPRSDFHT